MSKYVNVPNGDYRVSVRTGGSIYLDTGSEAGTVFITGDLVVEGDTTNLQTRDLIVEDRVIELNRGDDGASGGIQGTDAFSGIEINRGNEPHAFFGFDEDVGGFIIYDGANNILKLRASEVDTGGSSLHLTPGNPQAGSASAQPTVSVGNVTNYEYGTFEYDLTGNLTGNVKNPDALTNVQSVVDWVDYNFANVFLSQIGDGFVDITSITIEDDETTGNDSVIKFAIDGNIVSQLYSDRWEFDEIRVAGTTIESLTSDADLVLRAPGSGAVKVEDTLAITSVPHIDDGSPDPLQPTTPTDGVKIYVANQQTGKTGIYYVNSQNTRDELISKNRSLLFSMLF
jgi:hypothetical protein